VDETDHGASEKVAAGVGACRITRTGDVADELATADAASVDAGLAATSPAGAVAAAPPPKLAP